MNHWSLGFACVDLDGVICADPTNQQNDDGNAYLEFIKSATLLNSPRYRINSIVTSRLEKYRSQTERWLEVNSIKYDNLFMLDVPSAEERRRLNAHGKFKAEVFKSQKNCLLFIESETHQAKEIRAISGKSVLAFKDMQFFTENQLIKTRRNIRHIVKNDFTAQGHEIYEKGSKTLIYRTPRALIPAPLDQSHRATLYVGSGAIQTISVRKLGVTCCSVPHSFKLKIGNVS